MIMHSFYLCCAEHIFVTLYIYIYYSSLPSLFLCVPSVTGGVLIYTKLTITTTFPYWTLIFSSLSIRNCHFGWPIFHFVGKLCSFNYFSIMFLQDESWYLMSFFFLNLICRIIRFLWLVLYNEKHDTQYSFLM